MGHVDNVGADLWFLLQKAQVVSSEEMQIMGDLCDRLFVSAMANTLSWIVKQTNIDVSISTLQANPNECLFRYCLQK